MTLPILRVEIRSEEGVVIARQRSRHIAALLGFERQDQTRIATAVSEIARNAFTYATGGQVEFLVDEKATPPVFLARITDGGPGIANLQQVLVEQDRSSTELRSGLDGAKRLMDHYEIESSPGHGTTVLVGKRFPGGAATFTPASLAVISDKLAQLTPQTAFAELQQQNQELLRTLG